MESISEYAFLNVDGSEAFALADCITAPAQMPDVDALLAAVRSDPMPIPEPTATPAPAMPVGEEGVPFLGTWHADTMVIEGVTLNAADIGLVMELTLTDDGVAALFDGDSVDYGTWTFEDGAAYVDGTVLTLTEDGKLCMEEDGVIMFFAAAEPAELPPVPVDPDDSAASSTLERLERKFVCVNADMSGVTIDAGLLGGEYALTFHADGTADFVMVGQPFHGLPWTEGTADGAPAFLVDYYGTTFTAVLTEAGFDMNYFDAMLLHLVPAE